MSAVSVIVSIFCVRVNLVTSMLPSCVRAVAFGIFARILCVSVPDRPEPITVLDDHQEVVVNSTAKMFYVPADRASAVRSVASLPVKRPHLSVNSTSLHAGSYCTHLPHDDFCCPCQLKTHVDKLLQELRKVFRFGFLYPRGDRSETGGYYFLTFVVCVSVRTQSHWFEWTE